MAPRRGQAPNSLSPHDALTPNGPPSPVATRSTSPSSGFTQFLTKPSKWFSRSASASKIPSTTAEARSAASSGARKPKISRPTDPRPILDAYANGASRSVLDLSSRPPGSMDIPRFHTPSTPSSPTVPSSNLGGLGDLRNISRKGWSRSADDLSKVSPVPYSPIKTAFQERVAEYRGRSDSVASAVSSSSPTSPASIISGRHPFPSVATTPPSSSPPKAITPRSGTSRSSTLPSLTVSVSTPVLEDRSIPKNLTPTHVHTRSHSFTPKLPSKLATPTYSASSNEGPHLDSAGNETQSQPLPRAGFGFGFGGANNSKVAVDQITAAGNPAVSAPVAHRSTTLLSPPVIIEPEPEVREEADPKRSSQILFHSGFINRLAELPVNLNHANLSLSKGWKPYKLELKGSKLYFYKPPSDRAAAVKELFPSSLVPPSQEDAEESDGDAGTKDNGEGSSGRLRKGNGRDEGGTFGRKKRAYWGRRTHPDLIQDENGKVAKGTFEALVHEAVFGTTFFNLSESEHTAGFQEQQSHDWKDFASSVLLALPSLVGGGIYEVEFLRCCSYLVSGVADDKKEGEKSRVAWLANEYLRHHGKPIDSTAWSEWRQEVIPGEDLSADTLNSASGMPTSASTRAIYPSSPPMDSSNSDLNTFSPRPENAPKMVSLLDALNTYSLSSRHLDYDHQHLARLPNSRIPWAALNQEGLSRDILLQLDPHFIARSLTLFHRSILDQAPANLNIGFLVGSDSIDPDEQRELESLSAPLFGSDDKPHWLTKLLLLQIFGGDTSGPNSSTNQMQSPGRRSDDRSSQTSRTHSRSEIISIWARVGELCRRGGDECSWRAICAALCSRPVARLDKAWKRVDPQALAAIESWVYPSPDGVLPPVNDPRLTPWGGDIKSRLSESLTKARGESGDLMLQVQPLHDARTTFEEFRTAYSLCPRSIVITEDEIDDDLRRMVTYWREVAEGSRTSGLAVKFQRPEQFMSLSLAAESRRKGLFEPYFWSRPALAQAPNTVLIPLLFPEPLPTLTLIDRAHLVRSRVDSDAMEMQQYLRGNDNRFANRALQPFDLNQSFTKRLILGQGGTVISVYDGDLLLVVQSGGSDSVLDSRPSSRAPSRPPSSVVDSGSTEKNLSRAPSIRVKPSTSHDLNRKTSVARRSSLPSVSHRQNYVIAETSSEPPLRVVVQAGTLDTLVNILVHGLANISVSVADDNGEMTLREGMTRELVVDRSEFSRVWWNVFRSFVTPFVFFELLRKLYITSQPVGSSPPVSEYIRVANSRNEVLTTMKEWLTIGGGAQDSLDDAQLFASVQSFLENPADHMVHKAEAFNDMTVQQAWKVMNETLQNLKLSFAAHTMRPAVSRGVHQKHHAGVNGTRTRHIASREPPDLDRMDPEDFVDNLDGMACAAFSNVTEEDLYIAADLLEVQTSDKVGWFSSREAATTEDAIEIQSIYSHIQEVEPSSMISELSQDALYRLLPPGIRSCIRAFGIIRKWLISKIVAPRVGLRTRQARMELLIQAIEVARLRNAEGPPSGQILIEPCVRSFVEAVATSALLSVESRMHHRAWQSVALNRGCQYDSLSSLLLRPFVNSTSSRDCLTVDIGWLLERMLEVISSPDVLDSSSQEGQSLVNFDKRRHLCNLVTKAWSLPLVRKHPPSDEVNRRGFERLNNIEKEVFHLHFDHRGIKEDATREATQVGANGPSSSKKVIRPFNKIVAMQIEKNRRDKNLRYRLQREKILEQSRNERREDILNKAMRPRKPIQTAQKQHRNKKSMSAFLNFMRPISSAFGADLPHLTTFKKTPSELDFATTGKPALVLSVLDAQVAQLINNERSYTFKVDTEDGGHYLLQAMTKRDMTKWLDTISRVTQSAAKRRLTYLGSSPKPQIADHIHDHPLVPSRDPLAVFGVELEFLLQREACGGDILPGTVPNIIQKCLGEVESRGLSEVGIYRIAGATLEINALKDAYNHGESPVRPSTDIHAVCDLVKSWFRVLPEPVFPAASYYEVMEAMRMENLEERLSSIRSVVQALPQANFDLLKRVSEHLDRVTDFEEHNHMTAEALAIVFSPNLLRAPQNDFVMILNNMGLSHKLVKALITHFHVIFDDADPDAEAHSEDEYDPPIPEEEEEEEEVEDEHQLSEVLEQN